MIPKATILRSRPHRLWVSRFECIVGTRGRLVWNGQIGCSQAAHVRYLGACGTGMKPSDEFCVPLSFANHHAQHKHGNEREWWRIQGIDPAKLIAELVELSPHVEAENAV